MNVQRFLLKGVFWGFYGIQGITLTYLPLYFAHRGYGAAQIGLMMMAGPFAAVLAQPVWGYMSDKFGRIRTLILLLWLLTATSSYFLFTTEGYGYGFLFTLMLHFFMIPATPLLDSMAIHYAKQWGEAYGPIRMWGSAGVVCFSLLTGAVLAWAGGIGQFPRLFWISWLPPLLFLAFLKEIRVVSPLRPSTGIGIRLAVGKQFALFLFMVVLLAIPHRMNDAMLGIYLHDLGAGGRTIGWAAAAASCSEMITFGFLARYLRNRNELTLMGFVAILYGVRWGLYAIFPHVSTIISLQWTHAITFAAFWLLAVQYATRVVPAEFGTLGQSLLSAAFLGIAGLVGGAAGGRIYEMGGGQAMYGSGAVLAFAAAASFLAVRLIEKQKRSGTK
ncbi:MFS transporter [Cohnella sp. REN36]|uniref:MFS transporter n=1 Tax=Cohnella sp. REN36 TaxID=2887347 RepID=UPI001D15A751|nr:MFS transporter [Cohnella sp. REN36]MCC3372324.1 MFS transporter [Cohnella sp. REN36]